jgi:ATP-dependent Clp protease protease subunit
VVNIQEDDAERASKPVVLSAFNTIGLVGEITEETSNEVIFAMTTLKETIKSVTAEEKGSGDEAGEQQECEMELFLSTSGGNADDMFAIYDVMRLVREDCDIKVTAIGKVMSAGVLLLAAGTKGKRRIGKNCRIMMHSVTGGHIGPMYQMLNEVTQFKKIQEQYLDALMEETNMSKTYLNKLLKKKVNVYLTAEEAVELGIADEVF